MAGLGRFAGSSVLAVIAGLGVFSSRADVLISEFGASNDTVIKDDFYEDSDWIELYNSGPDAVDLLDWRLTDDAGDASKWVFPSRTIEPGSYLVVFASGRNLKNDNAPLHTNFSLGAGGEYLALIKPDGSAVSEYAPNFPIQTTDVSYGIPQSTTIAAIAMGADCQVGVPESKTDFDDNFANWTTSLTPLAGSSWQDAQTGVGFAGDDSEYLPLLSETGDLADRLSGRQRSACLRVPFAVTDPSEVLFLRLRMKFDDGFVAYVNGVQVAATNAPADPQWDSLATGARNAELNASWTEYVIPVSAVTLNAGTNIFAIQGFNQAPDSPDLLLLPQLDVVYPAADTSPTYFPIPTPGEINGTGGPIGPLLTEATSSISRPPGNSGSPEAIVTVKPVRTLFDVAPETVRMFYVTMFNSESEVSLHDDGEEPDATAGDGVYSGLLPTSDPGPGEMLRWRFEAADTEGHIGRAPAFWNPEDNDQYYGTVAVNPDEDSSQLPILHEFIDDYEAAASRAGTRAAFFYNGRFYDNVKIDLHGQATAAFDKQGYNLDFNADNRFVWKTGERAEKDINLLTNYGDRTHGRNTVAYEVSQRALGVSYFAFPVRIQRNGGFYGVEDLVEDTDNRMLDRNGLDPYGALYKINDTLTDPDQAVKKTRKTEDKSDLLALMSGLSPASSSEDRRTFVYDNIDLCAAVNYLASRMLISDLDHGHKNVLLYRDTRGTGEWRPIVWDVDLSFGHNYSLTEGYFDDTIHADDSIRPGQTEANPLYRVLAEFPEIRAMYLRRLRTLMDEILQPPGTENGLLESRMREVAVTIDPDPADPSAWTDGDRDFDLWGTWGRGLRPREETEYVIENYLGPRRDFLFNQDENTRPRYNLDGTGGDPIPDDEQFNAAEMVTFDPIDFDPLVDNSDEQFIVLRNATDEAVDISGWTLSGPISHTFEGGTVIPPGDGTAGSAYNGILHAVKDARAFRARSAGPRGGEGRLVQGNYSGTLPAAGGTIELRDASGQLISSTDYVGHPASIVDALRITEIQYHPADPTSAELAAMPGVANGDFEYLEFTNTGNVPLDLTGVHFTAGITFTFPSVSLDPDERLILAKNPAAFAIRYPAVTVTVLGPYSGQLDNAGERVALVDASDATILDFTYDDDWYPATDGPGRSLVLRDSATASGAFGAATSWALSLGAFGNPGEEHTVFAQAYRGWDNGYFTTSELANSGISGTTADPDNDGRSNWREYIEGTDPRAYDAARSWATWIDVSGQQTPAIRFTRVANTIDVSFELETSLDLKTWQTIPSVVEDQTPHENHATETVTLRPSSPLPAESRHFLRPKYTPVP